jgi:diguanylate cyclase (GGDEF)-like protein/PAS domain S-box-containing protein
MAAGAPPPRDLRPIVRFCGIFAIALGVVILAGWALGAGVLTRIAPSWPAAAVNTGLMFVACGVALVASPRRRTLGFVCAAFVVALSAATLIEEASGVSLGVDNPLHIDFEGMRHPGRPATHTAAAFLLLGCCLMARGWRGRLGDAVVAVLGAGAAAWVGLAVAGYLTGVDYLWGRAEVHGMSAHTALGLVVVLAGTFALRPHTPPAAWYARSGAGEAAARSLMVPALVLPFAAGALAQAGASLGLYSEQFGLSLVVVAVAAINQGLIYRAVSAVREHEAIRVAAERESAKNVERFTTLTREAPVGIFETDQEGKRTFVNERWLEITGLTEAQALAGVSPVHPDERSWVGPQWRAAAAAGADWDAEFRFVRPTGEVRWVSCHATPVYDDGGAITSFMGSVLDITDRRLAEERTGLVLSRIAEAVSVIGPDGIHLHVNDAARSILDDLRERYAEGPLAKLEWGAVDVEQRPVPSDRLPAEITRTTGEKIDEQVLGFPDAQGQTRWLRISTRKLSEEGPPYSVVASFSDVTAEREDAARLAEAQRRFEMAFDHAPIGVALVSLSGRLLRVNRALCEMIGYREEELLRSTFQELTAEGDLDSDLAQLRAMIDGEIASYEMEKGYAHQDGSQIWALLSVSLVRADDDEPLYFIAQILDVTERRRLEGELRHQAEHDNLTGLANRRSFATQLEREIARGRRYGGELALLMIDLDGFKEINDSIGHAAGDLVLIAVANTIAERVRDTDLAARLGGDEFAVLLPNTDRRGAEILAIDLVQAVRELRVDVGADEPAGVTASVGLACSGEWAEASDEGALLMAADVAMYDAKRIGRDGYAVYLGAG